MTGLPRVTIVLGTRPEAIKLAPVIRLFRACDLIETRVVLTGQHREMVSQVMDLFALSADKDLDLMAPRQTLTHVTCSALAGLREEFQAFPPALVLVQGDTTTAFAAALSAFYEQIPVGHVEAGLRTDNLLDPFPEEVNRRLVSQLATLHFAPTSLAEANLKSSGAVGRISVTGNTVIDALLLMAKQAPSLKFDRIDFLKQRVILATVHRRENWGERLNNIAQGIRHILDHHKDTALLLPLHRNPTVREPLQGLLGDHPRVQLTEPLDYDKLVAAIQGCNFILTDSGGLQEEAPSLGKPVLVLRQTTERPEAVDAGTAKLVGTEPESIFNEANLLLSDNLAYEAMSRSINPFGDGLASKRILQLSCELLDV